MKQITCNFCGDSYPDFDVAHVCSKGPYAPKLKLKMNERIDKLLVKSGAYFGGEGVDYSNFDPKKFAELLVGECVSIVSDAVDHCEPASTYVDKIKQQFGVEE